MPKKRSASSLISDLKRKTRKSYGSEEKIKIIIEGIRGESSIAELCRKERHTNNLHKPLAGCVLCNPKNPVLL